MSTLDEIEQALGVLAFGLTRDAEPAAVAFERCLRSADGRARARANRSRCSTAPPSIRRRLAEVNLRAMDTLRRAFGLPVGYSDHTRASRSRRRRGPRRDVIEKHFTLDRSLPGPDHAASLEPDELKRWSRASATSS